MKQHYILFILFILVMNTLHTCKSTKCNCWISSYDIWHTHASQQHCSLNQWLHTQSPYWPLNQCLGNICQWSLNVRLHMPVNQTEQWISACKGYAKLIKLTSRPIWPVLTHASQTRVRNQTHHIFTGNWICLLPSKTEKYKQYMSVTYLHTYIC